MAIKKFNADLLPKIRKLDLTARQMVLSELVEGNWATAFKGHGMEFAGYRAYSASDDAVLIDWKASLRSKSLLVKEYEEEKSVNVYFLFDVSNSMLFTSTEKLKAEYAAEVISSLSFAILRSGDSVGLSMYSDHIITKLPLSFGKRMHYMVVKDLSNVNNYGGPKQFSNSMKVLLSFLKSRALIIIVSDFIGMDDQWHKYLRILSTKYQVVGIMIRDRRDKELPKEGGQYFLQDPDSGERMLVDVNQYADAYAAYVKSEEEDIEKHFKAARAQFLKITTDQDFYYPLITFFKRLPRTNQ